MSEQRTGRELVFVDRPPGSVPGLRMLPLVDAVPRSFFPEWPLSRHPLHPPSLARREALHRRARTNELHPLVKEYRWCKRGFSQKA